MASVQPRPVIKAVRYFLAHTPGLVRHGSKPSRELAKSPGLLDEITGHLRSARSYSGSHYNAPMDIRFPLLNVTCTRPTQLEHRLKRLGILCGIWGH